MAEKHTPGPWTTIKGDEDDPERWNVVVDGPRGWHIAVIENGAPGDTLKTEEANARLIAAAPDLLAACKSAAILLPMCSCDNGVHSPSGQSEGEFWLKTLRDQIELAIAKATSV